MVLRRLRERARQVDRRFAAWLLAIFAGGLGLRIAVILLRPPCPTGRGSSGCFSGANDASYYHQQANLIADGDWFRLPNPLSVWETLGRTRPSALHPPAYSAVLGLVSWFGGTSVTTHRIVSAVIGATAIVLLGLVARRLAGWRAGLIAAALAALYPALWINDTLLLSEALYAPMAALFLLAAYRFWNRRTAGAAVLLGLTIGLATLTRPEALLLVPFTVLPLAFGAAESSWPRRVGLLVVSGAVAVLMLVPWTVFNFARFDEPVLLTSSASQGLAPGNCDETYYGNLLGTSSNCRALTLSRNLDESELDRELRQQSLDYVADNKGRVPLVMAARIGRTFDFYAPRQQVELSWRFDNRGRGASAASVLSYYLLLPIAVAGLVVLWRRRVPISPLLGLVATSVALAALVFALTRYRLPADIAMVVAAAVAIEVGVRRVMPEAPV